ncbi:SGNH/GDSL hydrolase family protein [Oceanirhabdus sp. W0125-5]|uniref:SGNH/GDSL hydrolase family protein n=1 Tax=Oceanirhabdus sp. W0125-5 TaxID=2999116 RepID=UPI0022F30E29|nr:GDSL-type esterase/lipase family protein [Oceanirhabdus sp. W0125-5]WBW96314.1 GDSL-type esterase/lipase family protein [Oceanirhabdus sp. W0125-5]
MRILFIGDSITEGIPGASYFEILKDRLIDHQLINLGKGGDTVLSLNERVKKIHLEADIDLIFLFVGVNDIFVKVSKSYPIIKKVSKQPWAKNKEEFRYFFNNTLEYLSDKANKIVVVPPLLIGEDISNVWNVELKSFIEEIRDISKTFNNIEYLDIREEFINYLEGKSISNYIPKSATRVLMDVITLKTTEKVDDKASKRGLHLTLDGVHPNSCGAKLIAECIEDFIKGM